MDPDGGRRAARDGAVGAMGPRLLNAVVLAEDYEGLRDWWIDVVGLELEYECTDGYHYAELAQDGHLVVGIADAEEMGATLPTPRANAVIAQLRIDDVKAFLAGIEAKGGTVAFGPSFDEGGRFWYGSILDGEGNAVWVVSPSEG